MIFPKPSEFTIKFIKSEKISKDAYSFYFNKPSGFIYLPGQYIRITLPHENMDERGNGRFFSLSSSPVDSELVITTRIIQSSFKNALLSLTPGQDVKFFGAVGRFVFNKNEQNPRILLAGGIGITPFHSIVRFLSQENIPTQIILFASFTTFEDFIFYDELKSFEATHPNIKIVYTITKPELSQGQWTGETGRISSDIIKKYIPDLTKCISMSCGPQAMLDSLVDSMTELGVVKENNRKEVFTGY